MLLKSEKSSKVLKIGITGGIGSGKTVVAKVFSLLGIPIYNADERARYIQSNNKEVIEEIIELFGKESYVGGKLNRTFIASQVFNNKNRLEKLNAIVHPKVGQDFHQWLDEHNSYPYILKEAAIFFEAGSNKEMDKMITVYAPEELRIRRILNRDTFRSEVEIKNIMSKQMSEEEKVKKADYVIYNDDTQLLIPQIVELDAIYRGIK